MRFCQRNPKPCPVIGVSDTGVPRVPSLGEDLDLRTDLPGYRVWQRGELVEETAEITKWWRDVAMYRTNIACAPAGPFQGPMVVSMRPLTPADAIRAVQITGQLPQVHG